jgi:DNA-binding NarL/FixJ family response regulator
MLRVIVVEDSPCVRAVWRMMFAEIEGLSIAGEFSSASAAIDAIRREAPDLVFLDVQLIEGSGMDVMRVVATEYPMTKVIMVSNFADPIFRRRYMEAGACAFFDKSHDLAAVHRMVVGLAEGGDAAPADQLTRPSA